MEELRRVTVSLDQESYDLLVELSTRKNANVSATVRALIHEVARGDAAVALRELRKKVEATAAEVGRIGDRHEVALNAAAADFGEAMAKAARDLAACAARSSKV